MVEYGFIPQTEDVKHVDDEVVEETEVESPPDSVRPLDRAADSAPIHAVVQTPPDNVVDEPSSGDVDQREGSEVTESDSVQDL